jgi:hypothetical protein
MTFSVNFLLHIVAAIWFREKSVNLWLRLFTSANLFYFKFLKLHQPYCFLSCDRGFSKRFVCVIDLARCKVVFITPIYNLWSYSTNVDCNYHWPLRPSTKKEGCVMCAETSAFLVVQFTYVCVHFDVYYIVISEIADLSFMVATFFVPRTTFIYRHSKIFLVVFRAMYWFTVITSTNIINLPTVLHVNIGIRETLSYSCIRVKQVAVMSTFRKKE